MPCPFPRVDPKDARSGFPGLRRAVAGLAEALAAWGRAREWRPELAGDLRELRSAARLLRASHVEDRLRQAESLYLTEQDGACDLLHGIAALLEGATGQ